MQEYVEATMDAYLLDEFISLVCVHSTDSLVICLSIRPTTWKYWLVMDSQRCTQLNMRRNVEDKWKFDRLSPCNLSSYRNLLLHQTAVIVTMKGQTQTVSLLACFHLGFDQYSFSSPISVATIAGDMMH